MEIINIKEIFKRNMLKTFDVRFNDRLTIYGFKILNSKNGEFVGVPSQKDYRGNYINNCFVDKDLLDKILDLIMEK